MTRPRAIWIAVLTAGVFACMAGQRIGAPGLYYDEVHQVPASFAWLGQPQPQPQFCLAPIGGVPWMTMHYSGAMKSALFAGFMRTTGAEFSAPVWRWFGIALVLAGWIWCCTVVGARWGPAGQLIFAGLLLSDTTILLTTRHDWGPTALALAFRFAFLAVWLRREELSTRAAVALGCIVGLSIFEKLSSVVLLAPLALALAGGPRRTVWLGLVGLGLGLLPLAVVNLTTWSRGEGLISLTGLSDESSTSWLRVVGEYLALGQGDWTRRWILDVPIDRWFIRGEALLMTALVLLGIANRETRRFAGAYLAIGAALLLLPRRTEAHHWIIGTPFQYLAIALLAVRPGQLQVPARLVLLLLLMLRVPAVTVTVGAIRDNRTAARFDPSQTRAAEFLAAQADALVVASTWGIANQVVCCAQGRKNAIYEPIYDDGAMILFARALARTERKTLYVVEVPAMSHLFPNRSAQVMATIAGDTRWREVPAEAPLREGPRVRGRKFVR